LAIAHDEDVASWVEAIAQWMRQQEHMMIPLIHLQQAVRMPLVQLWLALLLGGFVLESRGEFYEVQQIYVWVQE